MRRSRFSKEPLIGILKEHHAGRGVAGVVSEVRDQRRDVLQVAFEVWRLEVSEAKRLRSLEVRRSTLLTKLTGMERRTDARMGDEDAA